MKGARAVITVTILAVFVYAGIALASDVRSLREHLARFEWWTLAAALALAGGNYALRFGKWQYYLRRLGIGATVGGGTEGEAFTPIPVLESLSIFIAGFAMSLTPGKAGEVFRSALLASARGTPVARSAPIVVADRVTDLLALVGLIAAGTLYFPDYRWIAWTALAMVATVMLFVFSTAATEGLFRLITRFGPGRAIEPKLRQAWDALRRVMTPSALLATTLVSALAWALECLALWLILSGLGHGTSIALASFVYGTATIAGAIAMLPGGLGGTELAMRTMLTRLGGVAVAPAAAATLLVRLATLWFAVGLGFIALWLFRLRYDRRIEAH